MNKLVSSIFALSSLAAAPLAIWACSSNDSTPPASADGGDASAHVEAGDESPVIGIPDAAKRSCKLDNGSDPVALCTQKLVLQAVHDAAFMGDAGTATSWDSKTFATDTDDGGAPLHSYLDDLALGVSIANYHYAAGLYGDNEITELLNQTLVTLSGALESQLAQLPADYDGDVYARLRLMAGALRVINENTHADALDAIADKYGKAIFTAYTKTVAASGSNGGGVVFGTDAGNGQIAYRTAAVATAALAMMDMAVRHATDDPTNAPKYASNAKGALDYLYTRARDPQTGMYFASLVTSGDAGHDALGSGATSDALWSDVQATVMLTLVRAAAKVKGEKALTTISSYPYLVRSEELLNAMNGRAIVTGLGDGGVADAGDAGGPAVSLWDSADRGYFEGYVPSTQTLITTKSTLANGYMFGAIHHAFFDDPPFDAGATSAEVVQLRGLRSLLLDQLPENSSLFSVVPDQKGYFRAATKDYKTASEPRAASYQMRAIAAALEGLNEQFYGSPTK